MILLYKNSYITKNGSNEMRILAIEQDVPGVEGEQIAPFLESEARQVWDLYQCGVLREIYFRNCMEYNENI